MIKSFSATLGILFLFLQSAFSQVDSAALFRQAQDSFAANGVKGGLAILDKITTAYPDAKDAWVGKGIVYLQLGEYAQAQTSMFAAAKVVPNGNEFLTEVGYNIAQSAPTEHIDKSLPYFDEVLKTAPNDCKALFGKALAHFYLKKHPEAIALFEKGLSVCKEDLGQMQLFYASALNENKQSAKALEVCDAVLRDNSSLAEARSLRADILKALKRYDESLAEYTKLITKDPNNGMWYGRRGLVYKDMNKPDLACPDIMKAQALGDETALLLSGDFCFSDKKTLAVKAGTKLIYHVDYYGDEYNFLVSIKEYSLNGIKFDWQMSNSENSKGTVSILKSAIDTANVMYNYFTNGESIELKDQIAVFASQKMFKSLLAKQPTTINTGLGDSEFSEMVEDKYSFPEKSIFSRVPCLITSTADQSEVIAILNDPACPVVLAMSLGWKIQLVGIE